jgi:hypothetical protein
MDYSKEYERFWELPLLLKLVLLSGLAFLAANIALLISQTSAVSWKLDPGLATLTAGVFGLCVVAWQTSKGFANLIRSQENQAKLEREARLHKAALDKQANDDEHAREKAILLHALWAEIIFLYSSVYDAEFNSTMFAEVHENYIKQRIANTGKGVVFTSFDAPVFRTNISKLGLLGPSIGADIITVLSRADGKPKLFAQDQTLSNETLVTMYKGNADALDNWRDDLSHVARRIRAIENGTPDPGSLSSTEKNRRAARKEKKEALRAGGAVP